jgi:alpha,alpha-trehalase
MKLHTDKISACILDMDGVVTNTARLHAAAWEKMFNSYLEELIHAGEGPHRPFNIEEDYREYVDGRPRYDGVEAFLASRGISLPYGDPDDPPEKQTVCGLGNRKNRYFLEMLEEEGIEPFEETVAFIEKGRRAGIHFALISASRNARKVLRAARIEDLFQVIIGGRTAAKEDIAGKPAPDIFLAAADKLGTDPGRAAVIEDSLAGVRAGREGGFGLVIGIGRGSRADRLRDAGADVVLPDLGGITFSAGTQSQAGSRDLPSALGENGEVFQRLRREVPAVFLDYDGTLTPIVKDPSEAVLDRRTRQALRKLADNVFVAVISGRALDDIREKVGLKNIVYAGSHGFELSGGRGFFRGDGQEREYVDALDRAEEELAGLAERHPGVKIERKPFAIAVHFRKAEEKTVAPVEEKVDAVAAGSGRLKKTAGKKIFELRPDVEWDKGRAMQMMLEEFHVDCSRVTPVYIGDDTTDEDAFRSIAENGIPILVSDEFRSTAARYLLRDPGEVTEFLEELAEMTGRELTRDIWTLNYRDFDPEEEKLREAICTLGNGYFASRGAAAESRAGDVHYPGTYVAGCYNRLRSKVAGEVIENESLVNAPNWFSLNFRLEEGGWFTPEDAELLEYDQELDLADGILKRTIRFAAGEDREILCVQRRFVSMRHPHLAGLESEITLLKKGGTLRVRSAIDGRVGNTLVARYRNLNNDHLETVSQGADEEEEIVWLQAQTSQSHIRISEACRTRFFVAGKNADLQRRLFEEKGYIGDEAVVELQPGQPLRIEKIAAVYNSRDRAVSESLDAARLDVRHAADFGTLIAEHRMAWRHLWQRCGIDLKTGSNRIAQVLNLHIFHLLQTVSVNSIDLDVGVPPRGLHGEAYRGLIMWDELFVFPFLNLRIPDLTRSLLLYRYRRLPQARLAAGQAGYRGAMFPWQSGSSGREEAQTLHLNPQSGHWIPDDTHLQRHINMAVAYNVWQFYQVSGDIDFLSFYGAELIIEIARFCAGLTEFVEESGSYEIAGVMGPDEFHTAYPGADEPGLRNNAYTNIMAAWVLCRALDALDALPPERRTALWENLLLDEEELRRWEDMSRRMRIVFQEDGIISQFEGYDSLKEFDWEHYRGKYKNIQRLDRILEDEGDSTNNYKLSKQADVLMLFYLFSADELRELFQRLGYQFEYETIPRNIEYYLQRTSHGSTLSRVVHAWVLARSKRRRSWHLFCDALKSDISDIQGGTTHEGIHLGAMAGTVDLIQRCYTGLETREDTLWFNPALPEEVRELAFNILYRQHWLRVDIRPDRLIIASRGRPPAPIKVGMRETVKELQPGETIELEIES